MHLIIKYHMYGTYTIVKKILETVIAKALHLRASLILGGSYSDILLQWETQSKGISVAIARQLG